MTKPAPKQQTILTHAGREPDRHHGFVNTPVVRGSTVLFETLDALEAGDQEYRYGRHGTPTAKGAGAAINQLEGGAGTLLCPSGLSAIAVSLLSCLRSGDEVLVTDSAYGPTRSFCDRMLADYGISTRYFDPRSGPRIAQLIRPETKAIFLESPGSLTFEIQDIAAIRREAGLGVTIVADNTWATPLFYRPLSLGADIVVHAGTKMFSGHSDVMIGTITANERSIGPVRRTYAGHGIHCSPDDAFLMARGLRTLSVRMKEHELRALELAKWLLEQEGVREVLHPGLPGHPDYSVFARDFSGSGSLFSFIMDPAPRTAIAAMLDPMKLFGMGYSWGGFESLILPFDPRPIRTAVPWTQPGNCFRLHVGFEDFGDLKDELAAGLKRYLAAAK
ncbi:MAG: cystathionine beta-lyase [Alphaproteobacteria bacterium]|nr:cystathionine beta-lyase [Alphaproteobacteria bacterium]